MARSRNIKPGFFTNDILASCEPLARILFQGLWAYADREGRLENRPLRLKAQILPFDDCDVPNLLLQLAAAEFIVCYSVGSSQFIQVVNFAKHQKPHPKEPKSEIPAPTGRELPRRDTDECKQLTGPQKDDLGAPEDVQPIAIAQAAESREKTRQEISVPCRAVELPERAAPYPSSLIPHPSSRETPTELVAAPSADDLALALEAFNEVAGACGLPKVKTLTDARRSRLRARLRTHGLAGWRSALERLKANRWMHGANDRGWRADFDFMLQDKSFNRLIEGTYDRDDDGSNVRELSERRRPQGPPPALPPGRLEGIG